MRTLTRRVAALAIVSSLSLAGCGGSSDDTSDKPTKDASSSSPSASSAPTDDVKAADGDTIKGKGYTYVVPKGWEVPKQEIPGTEQTDTFAADLTDTDGFADNINVIRLDPAPIKDLDKLEKGLTAELEGAGAKDVKVLDRVDVDGDESVHIASSQNQQGATYLTEQYNAIHDDVSYVITFSFSDSVSDADREAVAASVLTTWTWAS